jgi:hypothetical protein
MVSMSTELVCACGRKLRVSEHHAGRRVQCPGCGVAIVAPAQGAVSAEPQPALKRPPSRLPALILLALLLPGLVGAAVTGWWYLSRQTPKPGDEVSDLALVPPDAQAFLRIRVAEAWGNPLVRAAYDKARGGEQKFPDIVARLEQVTGLRPEQVKRVCFVLMDEEQRTGWTLLRTSEPYSVGDVLTRIGRGDEHAHERRTYYTGTDPEGRPIAVSFVSPTLMVAGPEEGVKLCLTRLAGWTAFGQMEATALYTEPYLVLGGFAQKLGSRQAPLPGLDVLADVKSVTLTMNAADEATIGVRATTDSEEQAKKLHAAAQKLLGATRLLLLPMLLQGGDEAKAAGQLLKLAGRIKPELNNQHVLANVQADQETLAALLVLLPGLAGR